MARPRRAAGRWPTRPRRRPRSRPTSGCRCRSRSARWWPGDLERLGGSPGDWSEAAVGAGQGGGEPALVAQVSGLGAVEVLEGTLELLRPAGDGGGAARRRCASFTTSCEKWPTSSSRRRAAWSCTTPRPKRWRLWAQSSGKSTWRRWAITGSRRGTAEQGQAMLSGCRIARPHRATRYAEAERLYRAYLRLVNEPTAESIEARSELGRNILRLQGRVSRGHRTAPAGAGGSARAGSTRLPKAGVCGRLGILLKETGQMRRGPGPLRAGPGDRPRARERSDEAPF